MGHLTLKKFSSFIYTLDKKNHVYTGNSENVSSVKLLKCDKMYYKTQYTVHKINWIFVIYTDCTVGRHWFIILSLMYPLPS